MESDLSSSLISSPLRPLSDDGGEQSDSDPATGSSRNIAAAARYASARRSRSARTTPSSPAPTRSLLPPRCQEADIGDSPRLTLLRKQPSSSSFESSASAVSSCLGKSSSEPSLVDEQTKRSVSLLANSVGGLDITENGKAADTMLKLGPADLAKFRKWMIGFCIVNFDLEIGQGKREGGKDITGYFTNSLSLFLSALDYVYPPMELTSTEQKNMYGILRILKENSY